MIILGVCPCDTERDLNYWLEFREFLEKLLGEEVQLKTFKSLVEESLYLENLKPQLYFASPDIALFLKTKNYQPLCRFSTEWDNLILLAYKSFKLSKKFLKIGIPKRKFFMLGFLLSSLISQYVSLILTDSFQDLLKRLEEREIDLGVCYNRFFHQLSEVDKRKFRVLEAIPVIFYHYLMVEKNFYKERKKDLSRIPERYPFISIPSRELEYLDKLYEKIDIFVNFYRNKSMIDAVLTHPSLIIGVYKEKFLFANKTTSDLLEYSIDELKRLNPLDIIYDKDKELAKKTFERRLRGYYKPSLYPDLRVKTKKGRVFNFNILTQTIIYNSDYAGLIIGFDVTRQKQLEKFYSILKKMNKLIIETLNEKELFESLCRNLVELFNLKLAWIGRIKPKDEGKKLEILHSYGEEKTFLESFLYPYMIREHEPLSLLSSFERGKIIINENTEHLTFSPELKEKLLKREILSWVAIPFYRRGKIYGVLCLYSPYRYFFTSEIKDILEEIQKNLSFALDKIDIFKEYQLLYNVIEQSKEWILITDKNGTILYASPYVSELSGYSMDEIIYKNPRIFKSGFHSLEFYKTLWNTILSGKAFSTVIINRAKDGNLFKLEEIIHPVKLPDGEIRFIAIGKNITKEEYLMEEIEYLKFYDPLTGLYNFPSFVFKVKEEIKKTQVSLSVLILIDIRNLSFINYNYGINVGDEILKETALRLKGVLKDKDFIGRAGGDEFVVWISNLPKIETVHKILEKIRLTLYRSFQTKKGPLDIKYNGSIVIYPKDGKTFDDLFKKASLTLNLAKREEVTFKFFDKELERYFEQFLKTEELIKKAFKENLFKFYYQPYVETKTGKVAGFEALIRIEDKDRLYLPEEFIDYLESSPYLEEFEEWALNGVLSQILKFNLNVTLNVSAKSFYEGKLIDKCRKIPKELLSKLCLEITERAVIKNLDKAKKIILELKECSKNFLKVALDDFGTGYSSLLEIKELPVDLIKIDRSFIQDMTKGKKELSLVRAIIDMAHSFDIKVCAEGVESEEQFELLKEMNCDYVMGFYIKRPQPLEKALNLI